MGSTTPVLALPYPVGTDRVMDGDNAIQALAERIEARLPRGVLASVANTTGVPGIGATPVDITGLTITATLNAGRWYRASFSGVAQMASVGRITLSILYDGGSAKDWYEDVTAGQWIGFTVTRDFQSTNASHTLKVQASTTGAGNPLQVSGSAANPATFTLEDLGPTSLTELREAVGDEVRERLPDTKPAPGGEDS